MVYSQDNLVCIVFEIINYKKAFSRVSTFWGYMVCVYKCATVKPILSGYDHQCACMQVLS